MKRLVIEHVRGHSGKENVSFVPRIQIRMQGVHSTIATQKHCDPKLREGTQDIVRLPDNVTKEKKMQ